jgi:hypothetical protein
VPGCRRTTGPCRRSAPSRHGLSPLQTALSTMLSLDDTGTRMGASSRISRGNHRSGAAAAGVLTPVAREIEDFFASTKDELRGGEIHAGRLRRSNACAAAVFSANLCIAQGGACDRGERLARNIFARSSIMRTPRRFSPILDGWLRLPNGRTSPPRRLMDCRG